MKKTLSVLVMIGLLVGAVAMPAEAGKKKKKKPVPVTKVERKVEGTYQSPALVLAGQCAQTDAIGCVALVTGTEERYVTAEVVDSHGQPVYVAIQADTDGDAQDDVTYGSFCGATAEPIAVDPGVELHFWIGLTPDPAMAGCVPAQATTGAVNATFSNLP